MPEGGAGLTVDVLFASVDEPCAEVNLARVKRRLPPGSRLVEIRNTKGFANVLLAAEAALRADHFFLVDADAHVLDSFQFVIPPEAARRTCCIYRAVNPINDLVYGHGGIKVYDRKAIFSWLHPGSTRSLERDDLDILDVLDFPSGGSRLFLRQAANVHQFATSPGMAWRGAFREAAKLCYLARLEAFAAQRRQIDAWIRGWLFRGATREHGLASMRGAAAGHRFGMSATRDEILLVNDYGFLGAQCARSSAPRD